MGCVNTRLANATVSQPFQQSVYPSENEDLCVLNLFLQTELFFAVNYSKLESLDYFFVQILCLGVGLKNRRWFGRN